MDSHILDNNRLTKGGIRMNNLYIIGNGFDLHLNLETNVDDYIKILKDTPSSIYHDDAFSIFNNYGVDWGEYEESLANIYLDEIEEDNITFPDYSSDHEGDRQSCVWNMQSYLEELNRLKNEALCKMIEKANKKIEELLYSNNKIDCLKGAKAIVSFNYTSSLEKLFYLDKNIKILHIHGFYEKDKNNLIFGYKEARNDYKKRFAKNEEDYDYYVESQKEEIYNFYLGLRKNIQTDKLIEFLSEFKDIDNIIVLGHSMSGVDIEYMETIHRLYNDAKWYVSYYKDIDKIKNNISKLSFKNRIELFSW